MDSYYPPDMPAAWRLAYYANDFTGVLVPATDWQDAPPEAWANWHDETPHGFRFLFETAPRAPGGSVPATRLLRDKFAGWVSVGGNGDNGCLTAAPAGQPDAARADVILCGRPDLEDRRALGRRLTALAARSRPPVALIALEDVDPASLRELRLLAELAGLA